MSSSARTVWFATAWKQLSLGSAIRIGVPAQDLSTWCASNQVGFCGEIVLPEAAPLQVLLEQDLRCLDNRVTYQAV